jgi:hypothetical protein
MKKALLFLAFLLLAQLSFAVNSDDNITIENIIIRGDLEPTGSVTAEIQIKNYGTVTMQNIILNTTVRSLSKLVWNFYTVIDRLDPDETITVNDTFSLPEYTEAGEYRMNADLFYGGKTTGIEKKFSVAEKAVIKEDSENIFMIFGSGKRIVVKNYGNAVGDAVITQNISVFGSMFFSGNPTAIEGDTYKWVVSLEQGEEKIVEYKTDYLPLFLVFVVIVVIAWVFLFKVRTIKITKHIIQKKSIERGEEFTIGLDLKNATGSRLTDITIKDFVPSIFSIRDTAGPKPNKKVSKMGIELTWRIDELKAAEERLLTYKIVPVVGVRGQARLPKAISTFKIGSRFIQSSSDAAMLGIRVKEV